MSPRNEDFLFAQEAQRRGYVSEEQVDEAFLLQKRMREELQIDERIGVILVKRGWLGEEQARRVQARLEPDTDKDEIEGYRFLEKIGRGAMGTVYKAIHLGLQRPVAVKILRRDLARDEVQVERLKEEAKLLASLDHPNIVRALDAGESRGFPFVVMEYVEGETLKERMARDGPLHEVDALRIARGIADALEKARRMGVVHRDVKPGNIICTKKDDQPKLMDLGLAKGPVDLGLTQHGATVGTPQYISPEQAQDPRRADIRSDIYSLGATLYAIVTGRPPFQGTTLAEILTKVLYEAPVPPRVLNKKVSPEVGYLIERMMLKDPALRYRTPADVVHDIDEILAGRSIIPEGFTGNWEAFLLRKKIRKWTKVAGIAALVTLLLGASTVWWVRHEERKRALAMGEEKVTQALLDTQPFRTDTAAEVQAKFVEARGVAERWADVQPRRFDDLQRQVLRLEREVDWFADKDRLEKEIESLEEVGNYEKAVERLEQLAARITRSDESPAFRAIQGLKGEVRSASDQGLAGAWNDTFGGPARTLEELETRHGTYRDAVGRGFFPTPSVRRMRHLVEQALTALASIRGDVGRIEEEFSSKGLASELQELDLGSIPTRFEFQRADVASRSRRAWSPLDEEGWLSWNERVRPLVETRLVELERRIEGLLEARADEVIEEAKGLYYREANARDALNLLTKLANRASDAGRMRMRSRALDERRRIQDQIEQEQERASADFRDLELKVLTAFQAGELARVRSLIDDALKEEGPRWPFRGEVEQMVELADAYEALVSRAYDGLIDRREVENVALRNGGTDRRWIVKPGSDRTTLTVVVAPMQGKPGQPRQMVEVHPEQLEAWAQQGGRPLPPLVRAVAAIAALPEPQKDLRPRLAVLRKAEKALDAAGYRGGLATYVFDEAGTARTDQTNREDQCRAAFEAAKLYFWNKKEYENALWHLRRILSPTSMFRFTTFFDENEGEILALYEEVTKHIANLKLAERFPGARLGLEGEMTWMEYDFEDVIQLEAFRSGEARATGVVEPYVGSAMITPGGNNHRFHLIRGMEGLVLDRPFALPCILDPAAPITITFDLHTLDSPFFFLVDVDGLQVAVLSADPSSPAYERRWAFPEDVPRIHPDEEPPTVSFYGRGRGVAFHSGRGFGDVRDPAAWTWPSAGQGRHHRDWLERTREMGRRLGQDLFAFEPGKVYRVRVLREQSRLTLFVNNLEVASMQRGAWARVGRSSDRDRQIRGTGTGLIQLVTWTPQAIDNLRIQGVVLEHFK